jgi:hypothetical protein
MSNKHIPLENEIIFYIGKDGTVSIEVFFQEEFFWFTQKKMAELFAVVVRTINEHLQNIFNAHELVRETSIRKFRIVQKKSNRNIARKVDTLGIIPVAMI